jgi:hypothetical protein
MSALVKISEQTFSTAADITITGFTTDYDIYYLSVQKARTTQANAYLDFRFTTNTPSAGTPITTTDYQQSGYVGHAAFASPAAWSVSGTSSPKWTYISQNNNGEGYYNEAWIFNPADATQETTMLVTATGNARSDAVGHMFGSIRLTQNSVVDGIQIYPSGGASYSVQEAEVYLYGLKTS